MGLLSFSALLLLVFSAVTATVTDTAGDESSWDLLIRQVVLEEETAADPLLNAENHNLFETKLKRTYATQEGHDYCQTAKKSKLRHDQRHQPSAQHGVTKIRRIYLRLQNCLRLASDANKAAILPTNNLPEDFDWRDNGTVTAIKDQGTSCWSFSTTGALEGSHSHQTGELVSPSEQQLVDRDHEPDPDEYISGNLDSNNILKARGLQKEADYPYTRKVKDKIAAYLDEFYRNLASYGAPPYAPDLRFIDTLYWITKDSWSRLG